VHSIIVGGDKYTIYTGLLALAINVVVAIVVQAVLRSPAPAAAPRRA
jgi:SSS family solute:Na+ symporter